MSEMPRFDVEALRESLRPTIEALARLAREVNKLSPASEAFRNVGRAISRMRD